MLRRLHKRVCVAGIVMIAVGLCCSMLTEAIAQVRAPARVPVRIQPRLLRVPGFLLPRAPDLQVAISGPSRAIQGEDIALKIVVFNKGNANAPGTQDTTAGKAYMVDIVLSQDTVIPVEWATQPVYAGLTKDDFVEDMLMLGARISNTGTIAPGKQTTYTLSTHIPGRTPPGIYYLAAVVDAGENVAESKENNNVAYYRIRIGVSEDPGTRIPPRVDMWVMPYAVGNTTINKIKSTGLTDYVDTLSGLNMVNAPFGSRLGLRHGYDSRLPNTAIAYYRWTHRRPGASAWQEFTEPVGVHYTKKVGAVISFPVYTLGPHSVNGMSLYEFKPHDPPTIPGAITSWPTSDWFGDIYSGFLDSRALANGKHEIKLEVFDPSGNKVMPTAATFRFLVPTGVAAGGTITTAVGSPTSDGGFAFAVHVDNRACGAYIDPPAIGTTTVADECGFLLYDPSIAASNNAAKVRISFFATHPAKRAMFRFRIVRGVKTASTAGGDVSAGTAGVYSGDGNGHFQHKFMRTELLGPKCPEKAAFAANLHVYAKATNGWHHRLNGLDAHHVRAFALAPK